jgi:2-methylcitrate dehydratase PrpD
LEGRFGFFECWLHGDFDASSVTHGLGERWSVPGIFFKPYPANHFTHSAIDAALALRGRGLSPEEVAHVIVGVAAPTVRTIGEPIEVKRRPATGYMAQFSGPYAVAAALFGGSGLGLGLDDFTDELAQDPLRRALMDKVDVVADERCSEIFPYQFPAILRIRTQDGRDLVEEVLVNRGGPQRPLTFGELAAKYRDNAQRLLPEASVIDLERQIARLDEIDDIGALLKPLRHLTTAKP